MTAHKCFLCVPEAKKSHMCFNQVTHACVHFHYAMPSRNPVHTAYSQHKIVTKITLKSVSLYNLLGIHCLGSTDC